MPRTVLLASASTSRYSLLVNAGITPLVQVSHVDEDAIAKKLSPIKTADLCVALATAKGEAVVKEITSHRESKSFGDCRGFHVGIRRQFIW
jgi:septum formation protein